MSDARLPHAFLTPGTSSFAEFVGLVSPDLLPSRMTLPAGSAAELSPHATTIVAATFQGGVVMAGDRRATMGNVIAQRDIEKVFPTDEYSCVGIAGTAGLAVEIVRLFQTELEHYEKIEGTVLSIDGKANRLSALIRNNLGMAMQGLAVVPLFAGFDLIKEQGRIFSYDVTGGRYEETAFHSVGSGAVFARGSLKKIYRDDLDQQQCVTAVVQALYDAADDDSATGGPDLTRRIFPIVSVITADGHTRMSQDQVAAIADEVVAARMQRPDGPAPPMTRASAASDRLSERPGMLLRLAKRGLDEYAFLRLARAADEGPGGLRAQRHRPWTLRRGGAVRRRRAVRLREPLGRAAQDQRDLRPDRVRGRRSLQRVREPPDRRGPARRHARLLLRPSRRHRSRPGERLRPDARHDLLEWGREALRDRDLRGGGR